MAQIHNGAYCGLARDWGRCCLCPARACCLQTLLQTNLLISVHTEITSSDLNCDWLYWVVQPVKAASHKGSLPSDLLVQVSSLLWALATFNAAVLRWVLVNFCIFCKTLKFADPLIIPWNINEPMFTVLRKKTLLLKSPFTPPYNLCMYLN